MANNIYVNTFKTNYITPETYEQTVANTKAFFDHVLLHNREALEPFWDFYIDLLCRSYEAESYIPSVFEEAIAEAASTGNTELIILDSVNGALQESCLLTVLQEYIQQITSPFVLEEFFEVLNKIKAGLGSDSPLFWAPLNKRSVGISMPDLYPFFTPTKNLVKKDFSLLDSFVEKFNKYLQKYDLEMVNEAGVYKIKFDKFLEEPKIIKVSFKDL